MIKAIVVFFQSFTPFLPPHEMPDIEDDDSERAARRALRASTNEVNAVADLLDETLDAFGTSKRR